MNKIRVALVENHDLTREGILRALWRVSEIEEVGMAANATQRLQMLLKTRPDVAIVDIGLPEDGIELIGQLKASQKAGKGLQTKVLILTLLRDDKEAVVAAMEAGADSYCMKNISLDNLLSALRVTARGNAWIDPPEIASVLLLPGNFPWGQSKYEQN